MPVGCFAHGAFEHEHLIGKAHRVAVLEVDLHLRRAVFMDQRVHLQLLRLREIVHVLHEILEFRHRIDAIGLA